MGLIILEIVITVALYCALKMIIPIWFEGRVRSGLVIKDMPQVAKDETICHEMVHGMLVHLGYNDLSNDEQFVQAFGNAIYQGFAIRMFEKEQKND